MSLNQDSLPLYAEDLLKYLERVFGNYTPAPGADHDKMWFKLGQQSIVTHLKELKQRGEENILENS